MVLSSIVLSDIVLFNYIGNYTTYGTLGLVFWADVLLLLAAYVLLLPRVMRRGLAPELERRAGLIITSFGRTH